MSTSVTRSRTELRERIRRLEERGRPPVIGAAVRSQGDRPASPGWGLALGALHEVAGGGNGAINGAAAALFTAGVAVHTRGTVLWCITRLDLFAPALAQGRASVHRSEFRLGYQRTNRTAMTDRSPLPNDVVERA